MTDADKTIYKICREQAGYTQERAAELLNCSVRQLARYEADEAPVPDDLAYAMVRLYNSQYLAVEHLRLVSQLAASIIPAVEQISLQTAAMRLFNAVMDFVEAHPDRKLLRIAEDGIITPEERPIRDEIMDELGAFIKVCLEVRASTEAALGKEKGGLA